MRDIIFREVASNLLIHREYMSGVPARLIIGYGQVKTENANRPHGFGPLDPATSAPFPKNPVLGAFFREILRADELGSGMRKMMKYGKTYGGANPEMIEGDLFRMVIKVPEFGDPSGKVAALQPESGVESGAQSGAQSGAILYILNRQSFSANQIAKELGLQGKTGAFKRTIGSPQQEFAAG